MKKLSILQAKTFPEFSEMSEKRFKKTFYVAPFEALKVDEIGELIFAPDPRTGIPRSDLALILSNTARPEVAEYIRQNLQCALPDSERLENPDDALRLTKNARESLEAYGNRLRELCCESYDKEYNEKVAAEKAKRFLSAKSE